MHSYSTLPDYQSKDSSSTLYRVQDLDKFFNLLTFTLGIFSSAQRKIENQDIIEHQKSAFLVGTTSSEISLKQLQNLWKKDGVLIIDSTFIKDYLYDVNRVVKLTGTSFFTPVDEKEQCIAILTICTIKSIKCGNNITIDNPFYINPTSVNVIQDYQLVHLAHKNFLERLFDSGKQMSEIERQNALNELICISSDFYQNYLGDNNPYLMTVSSFKEKFGGSYFDFNLIQSSLNNENETIKALLMREGDKIFMKKDEYKRLLDRKRVETIMAQNEQDGYGSRNSYFGD